MSQLQASVEFSIELHKFYNVDLFQRGYYQIRVGLKVSPKVSVIIEAHIGRNASRGGEHAYPACIVSPFGVSSTFQVLYRNEEILLDNVFLFRAHILVNSHRIEETLDRADFAFQLELWFSEQPINANATESQQSGVYCASVRTLQMTFSPAKGLHYHLPVLFDYFHLSAVSLTIHAALVALHQPYIKKSIFNYVQSCTPTSAKPLFSNRLNTRYPSGKGNIIFFQNLSSSLKCVGSSSVQNRIAHARHVHQEVCSLLLAAYENLQAHLHQFMKLLPAWQQLKLESTDFFNRLQNLSDFAKACHSNLSGDRNSKVHLLEINGFVTKAVQKHPLFKLSDEDFLSVANSDIAQLCAENMLLWQQFLETFTCKEPINQHLAKVHHQLRVKRFAEAFFVVDNPRKSAAGCFDANCQNYLAVADAVRRSRYLATLPNLPVTCLELDGDLTTLPVIFEDLYQDVEEFARRRGSSSNNEADAFGEKIRSRLGKEEDCSCGIVAILESRSKQLPTRSATQSTLNLRQKSVPLTSYIVEGDVLQASLTLGPATRHSHSLDQLGTKLSPIEPFSINPLAVLKTKLDLSIVPSITTKPRLTHSTSSLTVTSDSREETQIFPLILAQSSESLPNLARLLNSNQSSSIATIAEELPISREGFLLSTSSSSESDEFTSEHSGWISNSSRHCSSSSSSPIALSPDLNLPDYSTLRALGSLPQQPQLDKAYLTEKLEKLVLRETTPKRSLGEFTLLPPKQFRDIPPPPEAFRDPPKPFVQSGHAMEKLLAQLCTESPLTLDFQLKETTRKRSRRLKTKGYYQHRASISDEGFAELDTLRGDSDTSTIESIPEAFVREKSPFEGYLFKEDIETLKKTLESELTSVSKDEEIDKDEDDCQCHDDQEKLKKYEDEMLTFIKAKEEFKRQMNFTGMIYSDFPTLASTLPYFHISDEYRIFSPEGLHLIICVHGLDGNAADLRLVKTYLELGLPGANLEFLMSERNQGDTFSDFDTMTDKLVAEILYHIDSSGFSPSKISFIGHSLGNIIIRSAITRPQLKHLIPKFYTFLSLSGPHMGTMYNSSGLINMGMWFMQKLKKSSSLLQLSLRDTVDMRKSFLYRLSQKSNLQHFRHVLLCGSSQDRYVPMHSARIELCKAAIKDTTIQGAIYREMVHNIMYPVISSEKTALARYDIHHALPSTANSIIGRAAHIAVLDSELFIEKFLVVTGLKYFR